MSELIVAEPRHFPASQILFAANWSKYNASDFRYAELCDKLIFTQTSTY